MKSVWFFLSLVFIVFSFYEDDDGFYDDDDGFYDDDDAFYDEDDAFQSTWFTNWFRNWRNKHRLAPWFKAGKNWYSRYEESSTGGLSPPIVKLHCDLVKLNCKYPQIQVGKQCFDKNVLDSLARKHSPYFWLHRQEKYFPVAVEWVSNWKGVSPANMNNEKYRLIYTNKQERYDSRAPIYVNYLDRPNSIWIQYIVVQGYNGCGPEMSLSVKGLGISINKWFSVCPGGVHYGDYEHITVEIGKSDKKVKRVLISYHQWSTWYTPKQIQWMGSHPVIYMAKGSHALYKDANRQYYKKVFDKSTDDDFYLESDDFYLDSDDWFGSSIVRAVKKVAKKSVNTVKKGVTTAAKKVGSGVKTGINAIKNVFSFSTKGYLVDFTEKGRMWKPSVRVIGYQGAPALGVTPAEKKMVLFKGRFGGKIPLNGSWKKTKDTIVSIFSKFRSGGWAKGKLDGIDAEFRSEASGGLGGKSWFGKSCSNYKNGYINE